ncbi:MAG TPA: hypothetical protein VH500_22240 [Nitrososphaeraceae archaeon]
MAGDSKCKDCWLGSTANYVGDYNGDGKENVLFYQPADGHWWLGPYDPWKLVSQSAGFGNISKLPTYTGNMDGDNKSDVLFYQPADGHWWLGPYDGNEIKWALVAADVISPPPNVVKVTLQRGGPSSEDPDHTHGVILDLKGTIKSVKNPEKFSWYLTLGGYKTPPDSYTAELLPGQTSTLPYSEGGWTGLPASNKYGGEYPSSNPMPIPSVLHPEIEIQG